MELYGGFDWNRCQMLQIYYGKISSRLQKDLSYVTNVTESRLTAYFYYDIIDTYYVSVFYEIFYKG